MKIKILLAILSTSCLIQTVLAQGSLTPPGAPAPTMKTLDEVYARLEARTPITNSAGTIFITQPGSYYLTTNLIVSAPTAISIITNNVTLDLNGYTISTTAASTAGSGILINGPRNNVAIYNGFILGGVTNNGSGVYSGTGPGYGIYAVSGVAINIRVRDVSVQGCLNHGICLGTGNSTVVESCTVQTVGSYGIQAGTIKNCVAMDCGSSAVVGDQVSDSRGESTGNGYGVFAATAQNCYGYCGGGSYGLYAIDIAFGCRGVSSSGTGLYAFIANSCRGTSTTGTPLSTTHNVNSF